MANDEKHLELVNNLIRLLQHLNFSDIHVQDHPIYPNSEFNQVIIRDLDYTPSLIAQKNGVIYFFEFIDENPTRLKRIKQPLQRIIELGSERWDADFVLITKYGNIDKIKEWCKNYDLPIDQIWEM